MKVAVVAEFYPRDHDPVLGVWAHRQALAARDAGADVRVLVLHRPIPPRATAPRDLVAETSRLIRQPRHVVLDGLAVEYVPFLSPPRPRSYGHWGQWAAPTLALALARLRRRFAYDVIHAHNAVPAGDAVLRVLSSAHPHPRPPLVVSVHGGDVFHTARTSPAGERAVRRTFAAARLVLANSARIEVDARAAGAVHTRVVHLGTDVPAPARHEGPPTVVTVAHLIARKRHADVVRALWVLRDRHPELRYLIIGDGPERERLAALAAQIGIADRVDFAGQLPHEQALERARRATLFVMPSTEEAFGVAYVEAMAGGLPAIGSCAEPGPEEIAAAGEGIVLVPPGDIEVLAAEIDALLRDGPARAELGRRARATVQRAFTWRRCGEETVRAYEDALA